jgi:Cytochrome C oxidase, cbb3-type, subunit III
MRAAALVLLLASCDWTLHRMQEQPRCTIDGVLGGEPCNALPPEGIVSIDVPVAPPPVTRALLERGRDRFSRFCAPCHGVAADGDSYISHAMTLRRPPPLVDAAAARLTDERILTVMATGYGLMPSYSSAIPLRDRYAILNFVRVLQHREVAFDALTPAQQQEAKRWLP